MKKPSRPRRAPTLTRPEIEIIAKYGVAFKELLLGERIPKTAAQKHFIEACFGRAEPTTRHEVAFIRFLKRMEFDQAESRRRQELRDKKSEVIEAGQQAALEVQRERRRKAANARSDVVPIVKPEPEKPLRTRPPRRPEPDHFRGIPEYDEGVPRPGWFTDEDWKKLRSRYP